jgi:hypothetical protein
MSEPEWTKQITSDVVCNFFYIFFVVYLVIGALSVLGFIGMAFTVKVSKSLMIWNAFLALIPVAIITTQFLFFYLICDRALKPGSPVAKAVDEAFTNRR